MRRAHKRGGVINEKFWFNKNFIQSKDYRNNNLHKSDFLSSKVSQEDTCEPEYDEFYVHEILLGKKGTDFKGIIPVMKDFMKFKNYSEDNIKQINHFLDFIVARAKGDVPTGAKFIRDFIKQVPTYKNDSNVSACSCNMLIKQIIELNKVKFDTEADENSEFEMITSDCISEMFDKLGIEDTPAHKELVKEQLKTKKEDSTASKEKENSESSMKKQLSGLAGNNDDDSPKMSFSERKNSLQTYVKSVVKQPVTPSGGRAKLEINKLLAAEEEKVVEPPSLKCCDDKNCKLSKADVEGLAYKSIKPKEMARCKLLGCHWFMGRTGFDHLRKESNEDQNSQTSSERKRQMHEQEEEKQKEQIMSK